MEVNSATLDALRTRFSMQFAAAYGATPTWYEQLATTVPSDTKSNTYGWKAMQTRLREWIGPRIAQNLSEHPYTLVNKKFEGTVELDRDDIDDDNLGIFSAMTIPDLGNAARKHPDQLLKALIQSGGGVGPTAFDGKALFADDHPTYAKPAFTQTYDNLGLATELDAAGVGSAYAAMSSYIGENGDPLAVQPTHIIVPPQLRRRAQVVMQSTTYALPGAIGTVGSATIDNPLRGWMDIIVIPELANAPTVWYMADLSKPIKPFVYQVRNPAELVARVNPDDPKVFDTDKFTWGVRNRCNVGVSLPFLISKNTGTPD